MGEKNKYHWISWERLCYSKDKGGLGFRNLSAFNQVVFAKQSWRIIKKKPDSLLFKVLRGKYFKDECFLKVPLGSNPSLTWRSICWGRDSFSKGYRWKVGNENYIKVDKDRWINRQVNCTSIYCSPNLQGFTVNSLLDENFAWKEESIRQNFSPLDAEDILNTALGNRLSKDEIIWSMDKKGIFSVKSAYHLAMSINNSSLASPSSISNGRKMWKCLWKTKVVPRGKLCVWNVLNNSIPTNSNIIKKGIDISLLCTFCKKGKNLSLILFGNVKFLGTFGKI